MGEEGGRQGWVGKSFKEKSFWLSGFGIDKRVSEEEKKTKKGLKVKKQKLRRGVTGKDSQKGLNELSYGEWVDSMNMHLGLSTLCHSQEVFANDKDKQKQFVFPTGDFNPQPLFFPFHQR